MLAILFEMLISLIPTRILKEESKLSFSIISIWEPKAISCLSKYFKKEKINPSDLPDNEIDLNFIVSKNEDSKKSVDYFVNVNKKVKEQIKGKSEEDVPNKSFFRKMLDWFLGKSNEIFPNSDIVSPFILRYLKIL